MSIRPAWLGHALPRCPEQRTLDPENCTLDAECCTLDGENCTVEVECCTVDGESCTLDGKCCTLDWEAAVGNTCHRMAQPVATTCHDAAARRRLVSGQRHTAKELRP
jgi:hypothetical protein